MNNLTPFNVGALYAQFYTLVPTQGNTFTLATDKPPAELAGMWQGVVFFVPSNNKVARYTQHDVALMLGVAYGRDIEAPFTKVVWKKKRVMQ